MASVAEIINNEFNRLDVKKREVDTAIAGQRRAIILNESYKKRFAKYTQIIIVISITLIIYLAIISFRQSLDFIPEWMLDILLGVIFAGATIYCLIILQEIFTRNITNYDELDLPPYVKLEKPETMDTIDGNEESAASKKEEEEEEVQVKKQKEAFENLPSHTFVSGTNGGISVNDAFQLIIPR